MGRLRCRLLDRVKEFPDLGALGLVEDLDLVVDRQGPAKSGFGLRVIQSSKHSTEMKQRRSARA